MVTVNKLTSQSEVNFGQISKTLHNLTRHATSTKKNLGDVLAKWSKLLCSILGTALSRDGRPAVYMQGGRRSWRLDSMQTQQLMGNKGRTVS